MCNLRKYCLVFTALIFVLMPAHASDLAREKRLADEIVDAILDGDAVFLKARVENRELEFLSIFTEADEAKGTAIILHGRGFHPDWSDAINPMRVGLAESGWNTLSVQMPVLQKQAKYYDYVPLFDEAVPRINSAIRYAREQLKQSDNKGKVVLIAHSCGAHMAMAWVETKEASGKVATGKAFEVIDAYIGLGMGATDYKQPMEHPFPLEKVNVPILDVYAAMDYPAVLKMADDRWQQIQSAGNHKSRQVVIGGSAHYYKDKGEALTLAIEQWLQAL